MLKRTKLPPNQPPLGLPPSLGFHKHPFRTRQLWDYRSLSWSEQELINTNFPDKRSVMEDLEVWLLAECKLTGQNYADFTWGTIISMLAKRSMTPAPVGQLSITEIRLQFGLDNRETDVIKKRLSRWRKTHEDLCRRGEDTGMGRVVYTYPSEIVLQMVDEILARRVP